MYYDVSINGNHSKDEEFPKFIKNTKLIRNTYKIYFSFYKHQCLQIY